MAGDVSAPGGPRLLVIGIGNPYRRDDGVGLALARRLKAEVGSAVTVREESSEGMAVLEAWQGAAAVILLDAVSSGAAPGTVFRFDASAQPIPARFFRGSTHAFSVAEAIELARALGELPRRVIVYGVEGACFAAGRGLSPEVQEAVERVSVRVCDEIRAICASGDAR